jgi:serine/threonine protein kinase
MPFHPAPNVKLPPPLDGYVLIDRLGRGGFGEVWKCEAPGGFLKAVKFVYGDLDSTDEVRPAEQELKSLGRVKDIRHPYILTLERYDIIDGQLMVVMELADRNLWDRFRECRMLGQSGIPRAELLQYLTETAEALDLMNDRYKLQHLDIKPQNLFLVYDHVKVADFGLAKAFEGSVAAVTGGVTPVYAAPETFQGEVSRFSDQYSLAIVFQELLTGVRPFNGANTKQLLLQHLREPPDLSALPEYDRAIIGRALQKEPNDRWPSCKEFVQKLVSAPASFARPDYGALPLPAHTPAPTVQSGSRSIPRPGTVSVTQPLATQPMSAVQEARTAIPTAPLTPTSQPSGLVAPISPVPPRGWSGYNTPLPSLITPKMAGGPRSGLTVAPSAQLGVTQARAPVIETGRMGALGIAPPEKVGDGVLFPALVVGLGRTGLEVIRRLRRLIRDRFGKMDAVPTVKFLYLDTDPDATAAATTGDDALQPFEVVLTKLQRPAHYLQREGLPDVQQWLPPSTLYQLPKAPGPAAGVRAFGRLALCDNYRQVAQRVRHDIEPFLSDEVLDKTAAATGLGVRSNRPRVYVIANLGGGTGGGTFLDLAYLVKHELRNVGYRNPEAHALLVAPPPDKGISRIALANTYAALAELSHYGTQRYQTRFDNSESPVTDPNPPFERCGVVQWPRKASDHDHAQVIGAAARAAYLDLFTPAGERIDFVRTAAPVDQYSGPTVQPFGVFRLSWPRYELLSAITRRFCERTLRQWASKESTHLKEPIRFWLADQWKEYRLDPPLVVGRFEQAVTDALRGTAESAFDAAVSPLSGPGAGKIDGSAAVAVLDQLIRLVGKPEADQNSGTPALAAHVDTAVKAALTEAEGHLATVAVSFMEQPQYRLAGAEEALTQITVRLNDAIDQLEQEHRAKSREATEAFARLLPVIGGLAGGSGFSLVGRRGAMTAELLELLVEYPRKRYRTILLSSALTLFRKLRDGMPECTRDISFCRGKLTGFADAVGGRTAADPGGEPGAFVLPLGCADLDAAAEQFIAALPPEDLTAFDVDLQATLTRRFRGLVNVCLKADRADRFPGLLTDAARAFLDARLEKANPAEALARYRGTGPDCLAVLEDAFGGAAPTVLPVAKPQVEAVVLAAPDGADGDRLRAMVADANPGVEFIPARLPDDVLVYREYPRTPIGELPQLGPVAQQAYATAVGTDKPPHARVDIEWAPLMRPTVTQ